jgi:acyl carrier protein
MGLEGVELVVAIEETFAIDISDAAAAAMLTPADVIEFIVAHVPTSTPVDCLTQQTFFRLRKGFRRTLSKPIGKFDLDTELADWFHKDQWPEAWRGIRAAATDHCWPESIPWPGFLRDGPRTVRQLIWHLVASLPKPATGEPWSQVKIEAEVRRIIYEILAKKDFELSAKFIGDLGVH